jgi:hypothetical protein
MNGLEEMFLGRWDGLWRTKRDNFSLQPIDRALFLLAQRKQTSDSSWQTLQTSILKTLTASITWTINALIAIFAGRLRLRISPAMMMGVTPLCSSSLSQMKNALFVKRRWLAAQSRRLVRTESKLAKSSLRMGSWMVQSRVPATTFLVAGDSGGKCLLAGATWR